MAIKFTDLQGKASKAGPERFKPQEGLNAFRIVGSVIPGYKYWLKTRDDTSVPMDCLSFNREEEVFDNKTRDVVREYFPEKKCSWAYQSFVIDRDDGKVKLCDHKKTLFNAVLDAAKEKMGDPTDPENGWDVVFTKEKTGPKAFNVEYKLQIFKLKNAPLSEEDKEAVEKAGKIEDIINLPTPEDQEQFIKNYILAEEAEVDDSVAEELDDDIPQ